MPRSPPFDGGHIESPIFKGRFSESPLLGKLITHSGETFPLASPHVSPKGGHGEMFLQAAPPHPRSVGNVGGAPPTLGDVSLWNTAIL